MHDVTYSPKADVFVSVGTQGTLRFSSHCASSRALLLANCRLLTLPWRVVEQLKLDSSNHCSALHSGESTESYAICYSATGAEWTFASSVAG